MAAIIQAPEDERKRIAKDLHDGIVQQLGGLKLGLQKAFDQNETSETNKPVKILDDSAQELRELSRKMMPRSLSELGFIPSIEDMLANTLGNTNIKYQFEHFGIKNRFKENIKIAILTMHEEKALIQRFIEFGVNGYFLKTIQKKELVYAIKTISGGTDYFPSEVTKSIVAKTEHYARYYPKLLTKRAD